MKGLFTHKVVRMGLPVVAVMGALVPTGLMLSVPPASADTTNSATTSVSCSVKTLLLPGTTTTCTTPVSVCPVPAMGAIECSYTATTVATALVGINIGGTVTSTVTEDNTVFGVTLTGSASASCTRSLAINAGCTGQTTPGGLVTQAEPGVATSSGQATCVWSGGPVAVVATLTCIESQTATA